MTYAIESCTRAPDREEFTPILEAYYGGLTERMAAIGFALEAAGARAIAEFWAEVEDYLPPRGCTVLARDDDGRLVGCGMLKALGEGKGELKRLFVTPEARGTGLGRRLVEARIEAARDIGLTELMVDTLSVNVEMRGLYAKMGFEEIPPFAESTTVATAPELVPHMHFFRRAL